MTGWPPNNEGKESAADLVGQIVKQKREEAARVQERAEAQGSPRTLMPLLLVLTVIAVGLTLWNLTRASAGPPSVTPLERQAPALVGIYVAAQAVDAYKDSTGVYPSSLEFVSAGGFGVTYAIEGSAYRLSVPVDTGLFVHRSSQPLPDITAMLGAIRSK